MTKKDILRIEYPPDLYCPAVVAMKKDYDGEEILGLAASFHSPTRPYGAKTIEGAERCIQAMFEAKGDALIVMTMILAMRNDGEINGISRIDFPEYRLKLPEVIKRIKRRINQIGDTTNLSRRNEYVEEIIERIEKIAVPSMRDPFGNMRNACHSILSGGMSSI